MTRSIVKIAIIFCCFASVHARTQSISVRAFLNERQCLLEIDRFALGQGGLSEEPMWDDRAAEIRALRPKIIRLFIQEYFNLLPQRDRYHFDTLDHSVDTILKTGAKPLMCICFKPKILFPVVNQDVVEPNDYEMWEKLIFNLVRHYKEREAGIRYWEVANEPDIGEDGGCPYRFKPDSYCRYYRHTAAAILRADPNAQVGGPALANPNSPILPALLDYSCYYHIRDYHVTFEKFAPFMSPSGTAFMTGWWNRMPQFDGLFDFQNNVRPAYFTFKLLSRLTGQRLRLISESPAVHGFMTHDERFSSYEYNLLLWNFSASPVEVEVTFKELPSDMTARPIVPDAATSNNDEIARLRPENAFHLGAEKPAFKISLEAYDVRFWSFERRNQLKVYDCKSRYNAPGYLCLHLWRTQGQTL